MTDSVFYKQLYRYGKIIKRPCGSLIDRVSGGRLHYWATAATHISINYRPILQALTGSVPPDHPVGGFGQACLDSMKYKK